MSDAGLGLAKACFLVRSQCPRPVEGWLRPVFLDAVNVRGRFRAGSGSFPRGSACPRPATGWLRVVLLEAMCA